MARGSAGSRSRSSGPVFAIGQHVFINCPGDPSGVVPLGDERGEAVAIAHLADGVDVEVVAWRPRGPAGPRYRVRTMCGATDGWVASANLRTVFVPFPQPSPPPPAPLTGDGARRFGQQGRSDGVASSPSAPATVDDAVGRRFGQRS